MKKLISAAAIAALLVAGSSTSFASTSTKAKKTFGTSAKSAGGEGTATHEMSESSGTQKSEGASTGTMTTKKTTTKKAAKKK